MILARRNRFVAAAIAGLGLSSTHCGESHTAQDGTAGLPGSPHAGSRPNACLSAPAGYHSPGGIGAAGFVGPGGTGAVAGTGGAGTSGGAGGAAGEEPTICLSIDPECDDGRPPPCVCLSAPYDAGSPLDPADAGPNEDDSGTA